MDQNQQLAAMLAQMQGQGQQPMGMPNMMQLTPQHSNDQALQAILMQLQQLQQMLGILLQAHYDREQRYANKQGGYGSGYNGGGNRYGNNGGYGGGYGGGNRYGGGR